MGQCVGGRVGVALTIRDLAETFPKEIEIGPDGVAAHLWSSRGARDLDCCVFLWALGTVLHGLPPPWT